jgi:hypothetical protein
VYFETTISKADQKRLSLHCKYNRKNKRQDFGLDSSYYTAGKVGFSVLVRLQQHESTHVDTTGNATYRKKNIRQLTITAVMIIITALDHSNTETFELRHTNCKIQVRLTITDISSKF